VTGRPRTVFFGSGAFAVPILEALMAAPEIELVAIVSTPDRPAGRRAELTQTPVARRAAEIGLPLLQPVRLRDPDAATAIAHLRPGLGVLADYGKMLPAAILDLPGRGIVNLHPSLLPRHRGATPVPAAILEGAAQTGVSLFRMDAGMDTGPIIAAEVVALSGEEDAPALEARLAAIAAGLLKRTLGPWLDGALPAVPQSEDGASVTRPFRRDDGRLNPALPAATLERQVRAFRPWPGTFLEWPAGRVAVLRAGVAPGRAGDEPGLLVGDEPADLALVTAHGRLRLLELQPAGGRTMDAATFLRGRPGLIGTRVG